MIGEAKWRIILVEMVPNLISLIAGQFVGTTLYAVLAEAGLEFIGLGNPSIVTWGTMLLWAQNSSALIVGGLVGTCWPRPLRFQSSAAAWLC